MFKKRLVKALEPEMKNHGAPEEPRDRQSSDGVDGHPSSVKWESMAVNNVYENHYQADLPLKKILQGSEMLFFYQQIHI